MLSLIPATLAFLVYFNCYQNEFLWDDEFLIQKNNYITSWNNIAEIFIGSSSSGSGGKDNFYRPIQLVYYTFIYNLFGSTPWGFHFGNILLHALNGFLVFWLTYIAWKNWLLSISTSLLWVVHPVHTEAITYMSGTADPLATLFALCSLICITAFIQKFEIKNTKILFIVYLVSLICFLLALLSKESVIVLILIVGGLFFIKWNLKQKTFLFFTPFALISLGYLWLRHTYLNFDETFNFYKTSNIYTENIHYRVFTFLAALKEYFKVLFYPVDLHMERNFPVYIDFFNADVIIGAIIFSSLLIIFGLGVFKKNIPLALGVFWFLVFFIPMSGIIIPVNAFFLEHWLYLPSMGIFFILSLIMLKFLEKKPTIMLFKLSLLILAFGYFTLSRNLVWQDPITFYTDVLKYNPNSARIHNNIAMAYADLKQHQLSIEHYTKAIQISDVYPQSHYNLARQYIEIENYDLALKHLGKSLAIDPNFIYAQNLQKGLVDFLKQRESQK